MAIQFFSMGFFNPQNTDQTLMCLYMMEFDGKDGLMQKIAQNGTIFQKLVQYMQMALMLAQESHPEMVEGISNDIIQTMGGQPIQQAGALSSGKSQKEDTRVSNARKKSAEASQPN